MKNLLLSFSLLFFLSIGNAQNQTGNTITVTINNAKSDNGTILVTLHTANTFMKQDGIQSAEGKIKDGKSEIVLENVQPGEYAILVLHDANDNRKMDFESSGMPKESYGMSNNVMSYGPPQYSDAKFTMKEEDISMNIRF